MLLLKPAKKDSKTLNENKKQVKEKIYSSKDFLGISVVREYVKLELVYKVYLEIESKIWRQGIYNFRLENMVDFEKICILEKPTIEKYD